MQVPTGETLPSFLGAVDQMGYSLVHGTWVDRVAESGGMEAVPSAAGVTRAEDSSARNTDDGEETQRGSGVSMDRAFPLQCVIGSCVDPHHVGFASGWERGGGGDLFGGTGSSGDSLKKNGYHLALRGLHHYSTLVGVVGGGRRVFAHRARYAILDVRTLQDFGLDDVVTSSAIMEDHTQASISHFHIPTTDCPYKTDIYFYNHPGVPGAAQGDGTAFPNHQFRLPVLSLSW